MSDKSIAVIGAGSWGTTLAILLAGKGHQVTMWEYNPEQLARLNDERTNEIYLPGVPFPENLQITGDQHEAVAGADFVLTAVPSHVTRGVCEKLKRSIQPGQVFINVSKGIENDTLKRMSEVIEETLDVSPTHVVSLYGPSHAEEVSRGIPTAIVSACVDLNTARIVRDLFSTNTFRVYSSSDIIGVELGGSLKNVVAIAAGICDGAGFGDNTKAALLTRALVEVTRLGVAMGAQKETFSGLSGVGDLIVTCMSKHSRNRHVGEEIGRGKTLQTVLDEMVMVAEGVRTTKSVHQLFKKTGVEMPIAEQVYQALFEDKSPHDAVVELMSRDAKEED
ncbi:MAG: NAD(P)H-dependent glycerol-3-phosphate dehydrogenase [Calditrichia bacterium]